MVRCLASTKNHHKCKHHTSNESGLCHIHEKQLREKKVIEVNKELLNNLISKLNELGNEDIVKFINDNFNKNNNKLKLTKQNNELKLTEQNNELKLTEPNYQNDSIDF